jgi:uncharacterized membrane protein YphA (DoxX/SURF4 family)
VRRARPWVGLAIRLTAASIWLAAGISKLADLPQFQAQVQAYKLLPGALDAPFAYALPLVEVCLGIYLAIGLFVRPAAIVACALIVVFIAAMTQAAARGLTLDCGCFGSLAREPVGPGTILRDAALGVPTLVLALWPARFLSVDGTWLGRPDRFAGAVPALR